MEVHGESGVLGSPSRCMGWVYGLIVGGNGEHFVVILDLRWEIILRLVSGIIFSVRMRTLRMLLL
jgi:hypothetical protein